MAVQVEDRPVVKEIKTYVREHHPVEKEFVVETRPTGQCLSCPMIIDLSIYNCFCPILSRTTMQVALYEFVCAQDVAINSMHECAKMYISCNLCRSSSYV